MKTPKCSECGVEIVAPLSEIIPGADWICLECSGASLSDFLDEEVADSAIQKHESGA